MVVSPGAGEAPIRLTSHSSGSRSSSSFWWDDWGVGVPTAAFVSACIDTSDGTWQQFATDFDTKRKRLHRHIDLLGLFAFHDICKECGA
eukprot:scaffold15083_cov14-Prasinocladus_malaysianus.AAC.1